MSRPAGARLLEDDEVLGDEGDEQEEIRGQGGWSVETRRRRLGAVLGDEEEEEEREEEELLRSHERTYKYDVDEEEEEEECVACMAWLWVVLGPALTVWRQSQLVRGAVSLSAYFLTGIVIITYNKWLLTRTGFRFPVTLIIFTCLTNSLVLFFFVYALPCGRRYYQRDPNWITRIDRGTFVREILPVGVLLGVDLTLTNAAFEDISVAETEVVKSAIPIIILVVRFITGKERPSWFKLAVILLLSAGVSMTSMGDVTFEWTGFLFACGAMLTGAVRLLLAESVLTGARKLHPVLAIFYFLPAAFVVLIVPFFYFESSALWNSHFLRDGHVGLLLGYLSIGSGLALLLNFSAVLAIANTSALTYCVVAIVRMMFVIAVTSVAFPEFKLTPLNEAGMAMSILGSLIYNWERLSKMGVFNESLTAADVEADPDAAQPLVHPGADQRAGEDDEMPDLDDDNSSSMGSSLRE